MNASILEALTRALDDGDRLWDRPAAEVAEALSAALLAPEAVEDGLPTFHALLEKTIAADNMYGDHDTAKWGRQVLDHLGVTVLARIVELLDARSATLRSWAAECFALYGEWEPLEIEGTRGRNAAEHAAYRRALPILFARVSDPESRVRAAALRALSFGIDDPLDGEHLRALLARRDDPSPEVRTVLAPVLSPLGAPEARAALASLLGDEKPEVRRAALWALDEGRVRPAEVPALVARLEDPDPLNAELAVRLLGELGDPETRAAIAGALQRAATESQRLSAAFALARVADASVVPVLREVVRLREPPALMAALILGGLGATEATDEVVALLGHGPREVGNFNVFQALELLADPRSAAPVRRFLEDSIARHGWRPPEIVNRNGVTEGEKGRRDALRVLGVLRDREARSLVLTALDKGDLYTQRVSSLALGLLGQPADIALLAPHVDAKDHPHALPFDARLSTALLAPDQLPQFVEALEPAYDGLAKYAGNSLILATAFLALADALERIAPSNASRQTADFVIRLVGAWLSAPKTEHMSFGVPYERATRAMHRKVRERWARLGA